jgi:hypothetical protein
VRTLLLTLLLATTASATPFRVKSLEIGRDLDPMSGHVTSWNDGFYKDEKVIIIAYFEGAKPNAIVTWRFTDSNGKVFERVAKQDLTPSRNPLSFRYWLDAPDPVGEYKFELLLNGKVAARAPLYFFERPAAAAQPPSLVATPATTSATSTSSSSSSAESSLFGVVLLVLLAFMVTGLKVMADAKHSNRQPSPWDTGTSAPKPPPAAPPRPVEPPPPAAPPRPAEPRKLSVPEMLELRGALLIILSKGGSLQQFVQLMRNDGYVDAQILQFGDWLDAYEKEEDTRSARAKAEAEAQARKQTPEYMTAKAVLGWDGQGMTTEAFKAFRKSAFRKWHPDRRQVYVDMGWSQEDFERSSKQATEALNFIEREYVRA